MEFYDYKTLPVNGTQVIDPNKTGMSFYDQFLTDKELDYLHNNKNLKGDIIMMSPNEYYDACAKYGFPNSPVSVDNLKRTRRLSTDVLEHLKEVLLVHKKRFPIPMLNIAEKGQEGLHRMMVIGDLFGWNHKVPVLVVNWYDEDRAKREAEAKHKYDIDYNVEKAIQETCYHTYYSVEEIAQQLQHELFRRFEYRDSVKVPDEIELRETSEEYTFTFEGYEYAIDKDDVELKDEEQDELDDIDIEDLESTEDFLKRYFGDNWRETNPELKKTFGIKESLDDATKDKIEVFLKNNLTYPSLENHASAKFIMTDGTVVSDSTHDTIMNKIAMAIDDRDNKKPPSYLVKELNYIRIGKENKLIYVELPDNIVDSQCESLSKILDFYSSKIESIQIDFKNQLGCYSPSDIDHIVKRIKQAYTCGKLYENLEDPYATTDVLVCVSSGIQLRNQIEHAWTRETCHPAYRDRWSQEQPSMGQCAITAMWLNEKLGWDIYETIVNRSRHFFNKDTNGFVYDLTADQFQDSSIDYEHNRKRKFKDLYRSCADRYELFKNNLEYNN